MASPKAAPIVGFTTGLAKQAADYLIREKGYRPVYNMEINGKQHAGTFYVNNRVMTSEDMIALAVERGFDIKKSMG